MQTAKKTIRRPSHLFERPDLRIIGVAGRQKSGKKVNYFSRLMTIIILLAVAVTVNVSQRALIAQYSIRDAELGSVLQDEQTKNEKLQMQISGMKSPERIEKIATEKLGMVKPAEISYIRYFNQKVSLKKSKTLRLIQNNLPKKESIFSTIYNQISDKLNKLFETDFSAQAEIR